MPCCNPLIQPFFNVASTTISYGPAMQQQYGNAPKITVVYWDEENEQYVAAGIFTSIAFTGYPVTSITVDHGSDSAQGIIKIG